LLSDPIQHLSVRPGSDRGIDGIISFLDDNSGKPKRLIAQVKSGQVKSGDIRDLVGALQRENAALAAFITLEEPTRDMRQEAAEAGFYHSPLWDRDYPRIQIRTVNQLLNGSGLDMPPSNVSFLQAKRARIESESQPSLGLVDEA
jgi:site-specific DNA-methyltransferase (adenine-specific)